MKQFILKYPKASFNAIVFFVAIVTIVLEVLIFPNDMHFFYIFPLVSWQISWFVIHGIYFEIIRQRKAKYIEHLLVLTITVVPMIAWFVYFLIPIHE